jgi:hypothetical protein
VYKLINLIKNKLPGKSREIVNPCISPKFNKKNNKIYMLTAYSRVINRRIDWLCIPIPMRHEINE